MFSFQEVIMKKLVFVALAATALISAPVSAQTCGDMCVTTLDKFTVSGNATFGGFGSSTFNGAEGLGEGNKAGYSFVETVVNAGGSLCGASCQEGSFTFKGASGERVNVSSYAKGTTAGETVSAINEGGAFSNVTFQFGNVGFQSPTQ